ncbi:MAG: sugar ABC transporter permease [Streptococcaceae bacterium]|jgi:arabinogalactan oligomer/maltooligosaccharide transport system permease protein|nr:sugar ABC transporter permease [Streptococcaceae bacterium]
MFKKKNKIAPEATYKETWSKGDIATKLSFFIMGIAQLKNRQWLKGLVFLILELLFLVWFVFNGVSAIVLLGSLGHKKTSGYAEIGGVMQLAPADNSMLILLFGILAFILTLLMAWLYIINLRSVRHLYALNRDAQHIPTTMEDLATLLNERFHTTLMFLPLAGVLAFTVLPIVYMVSMAFTNFDNSHQWPGNGFSWVGLVNFGNVLTGPYGKVFFPVLAWTLVWAVCATATTFFFGVLLAMLIESRGIKFKAVWRTIFVAVFAVPQFVSLLMVHQLLISQGALNNLLIQLNLVNSPLPFLTDATWARVTLIIVNMWIGIPVSMLVSTAIIQNLPQDQIEAARIDGAGAFQIFRRITFPQIFFVMTPALIQQFIGNINNFNVIYLLTAGGPTDPILGQQQAGSTDLLVTWLYNISMGQLKNYNMAAVIGILIFIVSAVFSLVAYRRTNAFKEG